MKSIVIKDKEFELFIDSEIIEANIRRIAAKMNSDLKDLNPMFIVVLNGSFMFAGELMKYVTIPSEITFVRLSSYHGTSSTGKIHEVLGLNDNIEGRTVVIVEDIVDTGNTMKSLLSQLNKRRTKEIMISTLLFKPDSLIHDIKLDYIALEIPDDFIVGYGLDYEGYGRNLRDIYKLKNS
ncbi:MAG: hypoxanthine phosphoribosyltransferase [Dysgonamonadaceae bacterium]|jgi:hypoxanthine phosphoribosyltransferase|nr:hypoxanthine phosphoribosyltransferase [Dysgonamonadaceae bacterium]MDD3309627.1 hypoxanthine phosphoribosyltransferase [Dysgonamonadaceae bacterium]MDD3900137.1 hypoxanthine phosphoribosyltransferase [Dysgonamonadaceae bacterium]MDD4399595.1 hypoxanthine phosphoribosyltransferase [Dysgonamonadaceae bacterium]MEA5082437.1 hypoxanthine phosphoribosyltransferase [Dysgonamonadaceae bacterium]